MVLWGWTVTGVAVAGGLGCAGRGDGPVALAAGWPPAGPARGLAGEGCQGACGEVAAGDGLAEVADGGGEGPLARCPGQAADGQAAEVLVVPEVAVEGLADVAAPAVGGDAVFGGQAGGHRGDGRLLVFPGLARGRAGAGGAGGFLQVAALAGGDQPVRPGAGEVCLR